ncbi:MAG: hypothetical protein JJLCMIEE_02507 [Acidimicrobiales bacterium]|nr:hypothetical protein [Acidimicrobiales bacterium]
MGEAEPGTIAFPDSGAAAPPPGDRPLLRARLLGEFSIEGHDLSSLRSRKARTLLKVLALACGDRVDLDRLVDALWGDHPPGRPEREVAVLASRARSLVGAARVVRQEHGYALDLDWVDLVDLEELADEALRRTAAGDHTAARIAAEAASALVRGPLLADEPDASWASVERLRVERLVATVEHVMAQSALALGDLDTAALRSRTALDHDPYDEAALRVLMGAHVAAGRPGSALAVYADVRRRLGEDLGVSPTAETEAVHTAVLQQEPLPGVAVGRRLESAGSAEALAGREDDLAFLDRAFERAAGGVWLVTVEGEPGVGRSRLLDEWARRAFTRGTPLLVGRCDELGRMLPFQAIADALAGHLEAVGRAEAAALLGSDAAVLGPLLGLDVAVPEAPPAATATTEAMQAQVFAALLRVFASVGRGRSVALVVDDVHLADPATLGWLQFVTRRREALPLLVVLSLPPAARTLVRGDEVLRLAPLSLEAVRSVVGSERAESLWRRSGGNPLLLVELAALDDAAAGGAVPPSVRDTVGARCEQAGEAAPTLRAAAVLGPDVDLELLAAVLSRSTLDVLEHLEAGVRHHFLEERGSGFAFRHELVREALVQLSSPSRQELLHREALRVLRDRPAADPLAVAWHARQCGDRISAGEALVDAGRLAAGRQDLVEAERLLSDAIGFHDCAEARLARGRVLVALAELDRAEHDALAARGLGGGAVALELRAWIARHRHDMESAIGLGWEGVQESSDERTRASCLLAVAFGHRGLGELPEAERVLSEALPLEAAVRLGIPAWLGVLRVHQGRSSEALRLLRPAVGNEIGSLQEFWVEHVLQMTAHALALMGRPDDALRVLERLTAEISRRGSEPRYRGMDLNYRGWILRNLGDPEGAELSAALEPTGMPEVAVQAGLDRADAELRAGRLDEAWSLVEQANDAAAGKWFHNRWRCEQRAGLLSSRLHLSAGENEAALAAAVELEAAATARGDRRYSTLGALVAARARARLGEPLDLDAVAARVDALDEVAGMEAWWMTADVAADTGVETWMSLAGERVAALAREAGERAQAFTQHADRYLSAPGS